MTKPTRHDLAVIRGLARRIGAQVEIEADRIDPDRVLLGTGREDSDEALLVRDLDGLGRRALSLRFLVEAMMERE